MGIHLITGHAGTPHVTSDDQRHQNAILHGIGSYVVSGCGCTIDGNKAHIAQGELLINGAYVRIDASGVDAVITSGTVGTTRIDYVVLRYEVASNGIESVTVVVKRGTTQPPSVQTGSILDGATVVEVPLYRIDLNGTAITVGQKLIQNFNATAAFNLGSLAFKNSIAATEVTSGTLNPDRIPNIEFSKVNGLTDAARAGAYIVSGGISGNWWYLKMSNGVALCGRRLEVTQNATASWGSVYWNWTAIDFGSFPFQFSWPPACVTDVATSDGSFWKVTSAKQTETAAPKINVVSGTSAANKEITASCIAIGVY